MLILRIVNRKELSTYCAIDSECETTGTFSNARNIPTSAIAKTFRCAIWQSIASTREKCSFIYIKATRRMNLNFSFSRFYENVQASKQIDPFLTRRNRI